MIDTQALRMKILDLAMRGKLTEQSSDELPACSEFTEVVNGLYEVPDNWRWMTIDNVVAKDVGGGTPSKSVREYWVNGNIPWMSVKDFSSAKNGLLEDTIDHITKAGVENSATISLILMRS